MQQKERAPTTIVTASAGAVRAAATARAGGGVLWADLDRATQPLGMATTGGIISHTGIAGLTLGGGLGHLMRKYGLTVDNLLSVDLVTANGERMHVDGNSKPELFWGLRGGGGNFGIVTAFEYRLHQVGPLVLGGPILWPFEQAPRVLRFLRDFAGEAPDELGITLSMLHAPPAPFLPPEQYGKKVMALVLVWAGDLAEGEHPSLRCAPSPRPSPTRCARCRTSSSSRCWTAERRMDATTTGGRTACRISPTP